MSITDNVRNWCRGTPSVTELLANDPTLSPEDAVDQLLSYERTSIGPTGSGRKPRRPSSSSSSHSKSSTTIVNSPSAEELELALQCGKFGNQKPSDVFARMWYDALLTLDLDPMAGIISPCLMGTHGTIPLTAVGTVWDVCQHMVSDQAPNSEALI